MGWNHQPGFVWLLFGMGIQGISGGVVTFFFQKMLGGGVNDFSCSPQNIKKNMAYVFFKRIASTNN